MLITDAYGGVGESQKHLYLGLWRPYYAVYNSIGLHRNLPDFILLHYLNMTIRPDKFKLAKMMFSKKYIASDDLINALTLIKFCRRQRKLFVGLCTDKEGSTECTICNKGG